MAGKRAPANDSAIKLGIALQGGGAYGAYTKGVLKALFNSKAFNAPSLRIEAVAGTSAGAVNGALLTYGLNAGGPREAIRALDALWKEVGENGRASQCFNFLLPSAKKWPNLPPLFANAASLLPNGYVPQQLKHMLERHIPDWGKVRSGPVKLFVNAVEEAPGTRERRHIVFTGKDLSPDTVAASGALEEFGGHVIGGRKFYDGAYWRNPDMEDVRKEGITDLLVITLQRRPENGIVPEHQDDARARQPRPGREVLTGEIHNHIAWFHKNYPHINLHVISLDVDEDWDETSRMNADPKWLQTLERLGYDDGRKWLAHGAECLGKKSSYSPPSAQPRQAAGPRP